MRRLKRHQASRSQIHGNPTTGCATNFAAVGKSDLPTRHKQGSSLAQREGVDRAVCPLIKKYCSASKPASGTFLEKNGLLGRDLGKDSVARAVAGLYGICARRGSQVVRHGSAKAVFVGSIPTLASFFLLSRSGKDPAGFRSFWTPSRLCTSSEQCGEVLIAFGVLDEGEVPEVFFKKTHSCYLGDG